MAAAVKVSFADLQLHVDPAELCSCLMDVLITYLQKLCERCCMLHIQLLTSYE